MNNLTNLLQGNEVDTKAFITKYHKLSLEDKNEVLEELKKSHNYLQIGYKELFDSLQEVKRFMSIQKEVLEYLTLNESHFVDYSPSISMEVDEISNYHNNVSIFEKKKEDKEENMISGKKNRGRTSILHHLVEHFNLTDKAQSMEEEVERIKGLKKHNNWIDIGSEKNPHKIVMNATYLASTQMLEANSKNANYSVLTRIMLNPTSAFFEGESVIIRNRYLKTYEEAVNYMERQINKISKQFFYSKAPIIIKNHGNRNSYYGFHLSKEKRENYQKALQQSK